MVWCGARRGSGPHGNTKKASAMRLLVVPMLLLSLTPAQAAIAGLDDAIYLVGWSNYLDQHCAPWHMDHRKAGHLLTSLPVDASTEGRITRGAVAFALKLESEGDANGHCQEAFERLGPRGLDILFTR